MVTKVNICDSLSDGAQTTSSTSSGYASHPSSNTNTEPAKLDVERSRSDASNLEVGGSSTVSTLLVSDSAVPGPVWPDSKDSSKVWSDPNKVWLDSKVGTHGSLPLRAGHVASQIQKLNIQLNQQETARVVRNREFVTSISVESEGREEEVITGNNIEVGDLNEPVLYQNLDFHREKGREGGAGRNRVAIQSNSELAGRGAQPLPGLTGRAWPGNSLNYTEKANLTKVPGMLKTPEMASDRCFGIRHKAMSPIGEEQEKDTRMNDSIVTNSLLMMTSHSPAETMTGSDKRRGPSSSSTLEVEKDERVGKGPRLDYFTKAVISSQHASTLSRAMNQAKRSFRGSRRSSLRSSSSTSKRRSLGRRRERSRAGAARHPGGGAEAMRELWERTGMKTNGRKLLIESEDEEQLQGKTNAGYQSDGSEVSVPRVRGIRKLPALGPSLGHRKTGSQSSTTSYDSVVGPRGGP